MAVKEAAKLTNPQVKRFKKILELKSVELRENLASAKAAKALSIGEQETDLEDMVGPKSRGVDLSEPQQH